MLTWTALSGSSYGLGITKWGFVPGYGHDGATPGFSSFAAIDPETGTAIIFGVNEFSGHLTIGGILLAFNGILN